MHDEFGEVAKPIGARVESGDRTLRIRKELFGKFARARERHEAGIRWLARLAILACRLAERHRVAFLIEDVVHDLERESDVLAVMIEAFELRVAERISAVRAEEYRSANERAGLQDMHVLELRQRDRFPH